MAEVIYLRRSYGCKRCTPSSSLVPEEECTCYYPCEEWWCPQRPDLDDDDSGEIDDGDD